MTRRAQATFVATLFSLGLSIAPMHSSFGMKILRGENNESFTVLEGDFGVRNGVLTHVFARETGHATLNGGAIVTRLVATDSAIVDIVDGAEVTFLEASDRSIIEITDGVVGYLLLSDQCKTVIKRMATKKALYPTTGGSLTEGGIVFSDGVTIQIWADEVLFEDGWLKGIWGNGESFSIFLIRHRMVNDVVVYERAISMPKQIEIRKPVKAATGRLGAAQSEGN